MNVDILGETYDVETTTNLYLNSRNLTSFPPEIGNLTNLYRLSLEINNLTTVPTEIGNLTKLRHLYLHYNSLTTLPVEICNLTKLEYLYLGNNNLTTLPAEIGNLTNLKILYLDNNKFKNLPLEILKIKDKLVINRKSYEIDNMDPEAEFIVLSNLTKEICNLPVTMKEIWLKEGIDASLIKVPFGCEIKYFL